MFRFKQQVWLAVLLGMSLALSCGGKESLPLLSDVGGGHPVFLMAKGVPAPQLATAPFSAVAHYDWRTQLQSAHPAVNDVLRFELPDGQAVEIIATDVVVRANAWTLQGAVRGSEVSTAFFHFENGFLNGSFSVGERGFHVQATEPYQFRLGEVDPAAVDADEDEVYPEEDEGDAGEESEGASGAGILSTPGTGGAAHSIIDIIVLYSPEFKAAVSSSNAAMEAYVKTQIEYSNTIYRNSDIATTLVLLHHSVNTTISNSASSSSEVKNDSGAQNLREAYGADLVSFWQTKGAGGTAGNYNGSSSTAFSTISLSKFNASPYQYTFTHELGHNMGAKHDRQTYINQGRSSELTPHEYKYGKAFNNYRTVMSYDNCPKSPCNRVMYFSNPRINYNGAPLGVAYDPNNLITDPANGPADNARRLNECRDTISKFKTRKKTDFPEVPDPIDTGVDPIDTGVDPIDTGVEPIDTGVEPIDTGVEPIDTGVDPIDTGRDPGRDTGWDTGTHPGTDTDSPNTPGYPSDPGNPNTPGYPSDPGNPNTPGYPSDPGTPGYPSDPGTPGYPSDPNAGDNNPNYGNDGNDVAVDPFGVRDDSCSCSAPGHRTRSFSSVLALLRLL